MEMELSVMELSAIEVFAVVVDPHLEEAKHRVELTGENIMEK
jgi:hypothetical protein